MDLLKNRCLRLGDFSGCSHSGERSGHVGGLCSFWLDKYLFLPLKREDPGLGFPVLSLTPPPIAFLTQPGFGVRLLARDSSTVSLSPEHQPSIFNH